MIICDFSFLEKFVNLSSNKRHNIHCMEYHKACAKVNDETYEMYFHEEVFHLLCGRFCCVLCIWRERERERERERDYCHPRRSTITYETKSRHAHVVCVEFTEC